MAERVVNSDIEFAYVSENVEVELKRELEKYFLYQNILIIDKYYEFGDVIQKLKQSTKCNIIVERNVESYKNFDNISCVINVNCNDLNFIKMECYKNHIPYILALNKICDVFYVKNYVYKNFKLEKSNYPIGIIFSVARAFDNKKLLCQSILEISSISFISLQNKICSLFFSNYNDKPDLFNNKKILQEFLNLLQNKDSNCKKYTKDLISLYVSYLLFSSKQQPSLLDNLIELYKISNNSNNIVEVKYAFILIITSLEKNFFQYYNTSFKNEIDYKKHQEFLTSLSLKPKFNIISIPSTKISFLLNQFRRKFLDYVKTELALQNIVKNHIAEINVDYLFETFSKFKDLNIINYLNIEQDIYSSQNFLTIMYNEGLLNFNF